MTIKKILVWLFIVLAFALAFKYVDRFQKKASFNVLEQAAEVELKRLHGHYYWPAKINDKNIDFLVDSGATTTAIPLQQAKKIIAQPWKKLTPANVSTANGNLLVEVIEIDMDLEGGLKITNLPVVLLPDMLGSEGLLGMDILSQVELVQKGQSLKVRFQ